MFFNTTAYRIKPVNRNQNRSDAPKCALRAASNFIVDKLEERRLMTSALTITSFAVEGRRNTDLTPRNGSAVIVTFSGNVNLQSNGFNRIRVSAAGLNPITGLEQRYSMRGLSASAVNGNPRAVRVNFGSIISNNARFNIEAGAIRDTTNEDVVRTSTATDNRIRTNITRQQATLAQRALRPTDVSLFDRTNFSTSPVSATANISPSANSVRSSLSTFLSAKVTAGKLTSAQRTSRLNQFTNSANIAIIPDANIRAAVISLAGTIAESAIDAYFGTANLTGRTWSTVEADGSRFGVDARYAETRIVNGRLQTIINPVYQGEDFRSLSALLAHEALHQDNPSSIREETITNAIETLVWAEQLDIDATPADNGTQLVARQNFRLLSLLNSGRSNFPNVGTGAGVLRSPAGGVLAGGTPVGGVSGQTISSFEQDLDVEYRGRGFGDFGDQPGNVTLNAYINRAINTTGRTYNFSQTTLDTLDRSQTVINPVVAIKLAGILKLAWVA